MAQMLDAFGPTDSRCRRLVTSLPTVTLLLLLAGCATPQVSTPTATGDQAQEPEPAPAKAAPPRPRAKPSPPPIPVKKPVQKDVDQLVADSIARVHAPLAAYRQEPMPSCGSKTLMVAKLWAGGFADSFARDSSVDQRRMYGSLALDVADAARERGCPDVALDLYGRILQTFIGSDYADVRQRAEQGMLALQDQ